MSVTKKNTKKTTDDKRTVSIRNMDTKIWIKAANYCRLNRQTISEYIELLIKNDLKNTRTQR